MPSEDALHHEVTEREIDRAWDQPARTEHRELIAALQKREVRQRGADQPSHSGDDGHRSEPPRMERAAGRQRLDDLLRHHGQEQSHPDLVHGERRAMGETVVALGVRLHPHERADHTKRQGHVVIDGPAKCPLHEVCRPHKPEPFRWIEPESTVSPVREIVWKNRSDPAISTSMKL